MENQTVSPEVAVRKSPQEILAMLRKQAAEARSSTKVEVTQTTFNVLPVASLEVEESPFFEQSQASKNSQELMREAETLRVEADKNWQQFFVGGRNATKNSMQKVYALFHATQQFDAETRKLVIGRMKAKLPEGKVRESTKEAAIFIRYVFQNYDDKQVHVYSTSLEVAFAKPVEPESFIDWVEAHKGEFEGIRAEARQAASGIAKQEPWKEGIACARAASQVEVIEASDWDEDEPCRIMIALPSGNGTAVLKDTEFTIEKLEQVLAIYAKAVEQRNKPKGKKRVALTASQKKVRAALKNDLVYQEQLKDEYNFDFSQAIKKGDQAATDEARSKVSLAQAKIAGLRASIKAIG